MKKESEKFRFKLNDSLCRVPFADLPTKVTIHSIERIEGIKRGKKCSKAILKIPHAAVWWRWCRRCYADIYLNYKVDRATVAHRTHLVNLCTETTIEMESIASKSLWPRNECWHVGVRSYELNAITGEVNIRVRFYSFRSSTIFSLVLSDSVAGCGCHFFTWCTNCNPTWNAIYSRAEYMHGPARTCTAFIFTFACALRIHAHVRASAAVVVVVVWLCWACVRVSANANAVGSLWEPWTSCFCTYASSEHNK